MVELRQVQSRESRGRREVGATLIEANRNLHSAGKKWEAPREWRGASLVSEYGIDFSAPNALHEWQRAVAASPPRRPHKFASAEQYVDAVRRLAGESLSDWRLIAVGWNHVSPRDFVATHADWMWYWNWTQARPDRVGSSYNADPATVFAFFRAGVPPAMLRRIQRSGWEPLCLEGRANRTVSWSRVDAVLAFLRRHGDHLPIYSKQISVRTLRRIGKLSPSALRPFLLRLAPDSVTHVSRAVDLDAVQTMLRGDRSTPAEPDGWCWARETARARARARARMAMRGSLSPWRPAGWREPPAYGSIESWQRWQADRPLRKRQFEELVRVGGSLLEIE